MNFHQRIIDGEFENKIPYRSGQDTNETYLANQKEGERISASFKKQALKEVGLTNHPKKDEIYWKAFVDGKCCYPDVWFHLQNLATLFETDKSEEDKLNKATNLFSIGYKFAHAEVRFNRLRDAWYKETGRMSLVSQMIQNPNYQQIIGMGKEALPLIYKELLTGNGHWYHALEAITCVNPVKPEDSGYMEKMREAWIEWFQKNIDTTLKNLD